MFLLKNGHGSKVAPSNDVTTDVKKSISAWYSPWYEAHLIIGILHTLTHFRSFCQVFPSQPPSVPMSMALGLRITWAMKNHDDFTMETGRALTWIYWAGFNLWSHHPFQLRF